MVAMGPTKTISLNANSKTLSQLKNQFNSSHPMEKFKMFLVFTIIGSIIFSTVFIGTLSESPIAANTVTVTIEGQGSVIGNTGKTLWSNQTYMQFLGIPFAESTRESRRFKAPTARLPWRHIHNATKHGRRCPVLTTVGNLSSNELKKDLEDCLNLCVYTKNISVSANKPVMFYVYGGGFNNGSNIDHPPKHLLEKDIILVVPNYRIGALGWVTDFTQEMPGNVPVMDVLLALQWVKLYIRNFGGNPNNVTIFGQSAGAAVTSALLISPLIPPEGNLFTRVILQSGSIFSNWGIRTNSLQQLVRICEALNCSNCNNEQERHTCLHQADVLKLLRVTQEESFGPVVGDLAGILPKMPKQLMQQYNKNITLMTGFTKHDGSFVLATYYDEMKQRFGNLSALTVRQFSQGLINMIDESTGLNENLLNHLLFSRQLLNSHLHKAALPAYFDLNNIIWMKSPILTHCKEMLARSQANVYLYSFDYLGNNTRFGYEFGNEKYPFNGGVHHSDDNIYLFSTHELNKEDTEVAKLMVDLWTSFAINGVPSTEHSAIQIQPMLDENGPYFHINKNITIGEDVLTEITATLTDPNNKNLDREDIEF